MRGMRWMSGLGVVLAMSLMSAKASANDAAVLSAGAVEPGLLAAVALFEKAAGRKVAVTFNTAPQIRERVEKGGERFDAVVLPPAAMDAFVKAGLVGSERLMLGRVGQGMAVRAGVAMPEVASVAALERTVREADAVVFNRATGGQYIESMFRKLGVYESIESKTVRYASAGDVMEHLLKGKGRELGFAPITEILPYTKKGLVYVGPLPADVQQRNAYVFSVTQGAKNAETANALMRFLETPAARQALVAGGVE